jgi:hypothetical protein
MRPYVTGLGGWKCLSGVSNGSHPISFRFVLFYSGSLTIHPWGSFQCHDWYSVLAVGVVVASLLFRIFYTIPR